MHESRLILDRLAVIKIEATLWSGRKKLRPEDLILGDGSRLPPPDLATLGSKRIADPRDVQVFARLKKEGERSCQRVGSRFLGGYAIPEPELPSVLQSLDRIQNEFEAARFDFLSRYDQAVAAWANQHPDFSEAIRRAVDPVGKVAHQLGFDFVVFRLKTPEGNASTLERKLRGLSETLLSEVAQEARTYVHSSLVGRTEVTRRALTPLKRIRDKLQGLSFLDPVIQEWIDPINEVLDRIPSKGEIRGGILREIEAVVMRLAGETPPIEEVELPVIQTVADPWSDPLPGIVRTTPSLNVMPPRHAFWF
jgi:Protein of unknown function (DUF3150)